MRTPLNTPEISLNETITLPVEDPIISRSYRGFYSIDQEMEREIAILWFAKSQKKIPFSKHEAYKLR